jgi:hypothetical protein
VHVRATAPSCHFTTSVRESGVEGAVRAHGQGEDGRARIEARVRLTSDHTYHETGVIAFGDGGHRLRFSSVGEGYIGPSAAPELRSGAVVWRVDGGEGQFAGASGLITANFTVGPTGELTVNQLGVLFVPSRSDAERRRA